MILEKAQCLIEEELQSRQDTTLNVDQILKELNQAHAVGYSLDLDEHTNGISAIGAAFSDLSGKYYAISIPVPSQRFVQCRELLIEHLLASVARAAEITGQRL